MLYYELSGWGQANVKVDEMLDPESNAGPPTDATSGSSCGPVTIVASLGKDRFVGRCTCGYLHLVWDNASLSLRLRDLQQLLGTPLRQEPTIANQFEMRLDPAGGLQLWAGTGGIRVSTLERPALEEMLRTAVDSCFMLSSPPEALIQTSVAAKLPN